jgi:hypothetical protein
MATVFWDRKGVLTLEFMQQGTTITLQVYCETLQKLCRSIQNKRCAMLLLHDNARSHTRWYWKVPRLLCCNRLGERGCEGRPRSHFRKPIASVCHVTPRWEHAMFLHKCFLDFMCRFVCDWWHNRATCLDQVVKFGKPSTETLEMLREDFGEHF